MAILLTAHVLESLSAGVYSLSLLFSLHSACHPNTQRRNMHLPHPPTKGVRILDPIHCLRGNALRTCHVPWIHHVPL